MIPVEKAINTVWKTARLLPTEKIGLLNCHGRVLAEDIKTPFDYPPFDRAAMDGYAVKVDDTYTATKNKPVLLQVAGEVQAGDYRRLRLVPGKCFSVMTGSKLPEGTEAVVKIEDVKITGSYIKVFRPVKKGENISFKGEDLNKGKIIIEKGTFIDSAIVMMLAYLGKSKIEVRKQPQISIVPTGDELIEPGMRFTGCKFYNGNGYGRCALVKENGGIPHVLGVARDNEKDLTNLLKKALDYDIALISGGVSEGKFDLVTNVLRVLGVKKIFWKVAEKPGKPVFFGKRSSTLVFGLPGYPVSTYLSFHMLVKVAIKKMLGYKQPEKLFLYCTLSTDIKNNGDRASLFRGKIIPANNENFFIPYHKQKSGMLSSITETNGLLVVEKGVSIRKGQKVKVEILRSSKPDITNPGKF
ncbi:MAG: molybdopterin molybdotransferase MoeA [Candidatus Omnitrophica bacterium]|nr:molybdopterin molybdotransferase MoeA [Candidatus Omnitrophota bacterium]